MRNAPRACGDLSEKTDRYFIALHRSKAQKKKQGGANEISNITSKFFLGSIFEAIYYSKFKICTFVCAHVYVFV